MTGGHVVVITSNAEFEEQIKAAKAAGKKVVVKFTATWCGPCHMIAPEFVKLSDEYDGIVFLEVDVDKVEEVASACGISAMPTFHVYKDVGEKADELVGANKDKLVELIKAHVSGASV